MNHAQINIKTSRLLGWLICIAIFSAACQQQEQKPEPVSLSPHERYQQNLIDTLSSTQEWILASHTVLDQPVSVEVPFQAKSVYFQDEANAWGWKFTAAEGRKLEIQLKEQNLIHQVFLDLFALSDNDTLLVASQLNKGIEYVIPQTQTYLLRLQTELDINGSFTLQLTDHPSLILPVAGAGFYDIGGKFGDSRGNRSHQGIDIFAEHRTPAIAAADGWVSKVGTARLGGKIVWLNTKHKSLYYAHLDSILINQGEAIQQGDTLGLVGTTGNARSTPPHLHFGVYGYRRAVDPMPFIEETNLSLPPIETTPSVFNKWAQLQAENVNIWSDPSTQRPSGLVLNKSDEVKIVGGTGSWYHIRLSDGRDGFIDKHFLEPSTPPITSTQAEAELSK